jgi:hypothetical protein
VTVGARVRHTFAASDPHSLFSWAGSYWAEDTTNAAGTALTLWADRSGNGRNMSEPLNDGISTELVSGRRAHYAYTTGGKTPTFSSLRTPAATFALSSYTVAMVVYLPAVGTAQRVVHAQAGLHVAITVSPYWQIQASSLSTAATSSPTTVAAGWHVVIATATAAAGDTGEALYVDGSTVIGPTNLTTVPNLGDVWIASGTTSGNYPRVAYVGVRSGVFTAGDRSRFREWARATYGGLP